MRWLLLFAMAGCSAPPLSSSEQGCHDVFAGFRSASTACGYVPVTPDEEVCEKAIWHDEFKLQSCLSWLHSNPCGELTVPAFKERCFVFQLRDW